MYYYSGFGHRSMLDVAKLVPDARSMDLLIRVDRDEDFDCLVANRPWF